MSEYLWDVIEMRARQLWSGVEYPPFVCLDDLAHSEESIIREFFKLYNDGAFDQVDEKLLRYFERTVKGGNNGPK